MSINLVTYANQTVTPTNDAIIYERAIDQNGIFHGCNVTVSGNEVHITGGYGMVCGREFVIESEVIPVTLAPSGTNDGRLYVRLDLADADAPIQLLTAQGNPLPALEQDTDVNYVNGAYEMELATFTVGVSSLSDVVETFETIGGKFKGKYTLLGTTSLDNIDLTLNDDIDNYKYLLVHVVDLEYGAVETTGFIPVDLFKTYDTVAKSFGTNTYKNGRIYGYLNYVDNTTVHTQISTGRKINIYGLY